MLIKIHFRLKCMALSLPCTLWADFPAGCRELLTGFWFLSKTKMGSWDCALHPNSTLETCTESWEEVTQSMNPDGHLNTTAAMEAPFPQRWHCQHLLPPLSCRLCQPTHPIPQTPSTLWLSWLTQGSQGHHSLPNPHSWQLECLLPEQTPLWDPVLPHNSCCQPLSLMSSFRSLSCTLMLQRWAFVISFWL